MSFRHSVSLALVAAVTAAFSSGGAAAESQGIRGQVSAIESTILSAPVSGRLTEVTRRIGESVKKGEVLFRFDCRSLGAEKDVAKARLSASLAEKRVNARLASFGNISNLDVELSDAAVQEARAELKRAESYVEDCVVLAPFSSEVVSRAVNPFQFIGHGEPMMELVNTDDFEIEAVIPAAWLSHIKLGSELSFVADSTGTRLNARVARIIDRIDPVSQTLKIIAKPEAHDGNGIKPGMSGEIVFDNPEIPVLSDWQFGTTRGASSTL